MSFKTNRKFAWLLLAFLAIATLAIVAIPVWVVQPFKPQTARGLEVSYVLRRWSPYLTVVGLGGMMLLIGLLWRSARMFVKVLLVIGLLPVLAAAWFSRQNHFEWMFNPFPNSSYVKTGEVKHVDDSDMVLTVEINGEAVAYPVRIMAYHHLVEDVVGGRPIVATY